MSDSVNAISGGHHKNNHVQSMVGQQGASQLANRQAVNAKKTSTTNSIPGIPDSSQLSPELQELLQTDPTLQQEAQSDPQILQILQNLSSGQLQQLEQNPNQLNQILSSAGG